MLLFYQISAWVFLIHMFLYAGFYCINFIIQMFIISHWKCFLLPFPGQFQLTIIFGRKKLFLVWHPAAGAASVGGERKIQAIIVLSFDRQVCFFNEYPWEAKRSAIFMQDRSQEGEGTVCFTHEQNIICSQTLLDGIAHEQTIICRQLFAGHVVGFRPMKRKENLLRMIIIIINQFSHMIDFPQLKKSNLISSASS